MNPGHHDQPPGLDHSATKKNQERSMSKILQFKNLIEWSGFDASELIKSLESISDSE